MRSIVLQSRIKRVGCPWEDHMKYTADREISALDNARRDMLQRKEGGRHADTYYNSKREWRVIVRETTEHVVE